jgi:hypothetical protein
MDTYLKDNKQSDKDFKIKPKLNEDIIKKLKTPLEEQVRSVTQLNEDIIQSEIEYDELFDLMAKRRQNLEKK